MLELFIEILLVNLDLGYNLILLEFVVIFMAQHYDDDDYDQQLKMILIGKMLVLIQ